MSTDWATLVPGLKININFILIIRRYMVGGGYLNIEKRGKEEDGGRCAQYLTAAEVPRVHPLT